VKVIIVLLVVLLALGCSNNIPKNELIFNPVLSESNSLQYLSGTLPLDGKLIKMPFLYDGDVLLLTEYDRAYWYNKPFNTLHDEQNLILEMQIFVNYKNGRLYGNKGEILFNKFYINLLAKLSPYKEASYDSNYLVVNLIKDKLTKAVTYVIEEYKTGKIVGFID
jgi:hypothetical protein